MKKVALVITKSNFGGAQRYVYDLATNLPKDQFEVVVIAGGNGVLIDRLLQGNIRVIPLKSLERDINLIKEFMSFKELFNVLKNERPDIVHLNSSKAGGIGGLIARILGIEKIIFTAHAWAFNEDRYLLSKLAIYFFHWLTIIFSKKTIAVSESVKRQVKHLPFISKKIKTIHLGIDSPQFIERSETEKELSIKLSESKLNIVTIAELHPIKGLVNAIDAMAIIRDGESELFEKIKYFIFGEGGERKILENHISKRRLNDSVTLLGFKENASKYLRSFDLFILPSLSEAFGYVLLEAGYAEIPIIASNIGGIPEIIEERKTGLLMEKANSKMLSNMLISYINDPKIPQNMAINLRSKIKDLFNLQKMIECTIDIYMS